MRHRITKDIAPKILYWVKNRGGVEVWRSVSFSSPREEWLTPVLGPEGKPVPGKPHWSAGEKPVKVLTQLEEFEVAVPREVKRFKVSVRRGSSNPRLLKLTDASSAKVKKAERDFTCYSCKACGFRALQKKFKWKRLEHGTLVGPWCPQCGSYKTEDELAYHTFDYATQEAIIWVHDMAMPLEQYSAEMEVA